MVAIEQHRKSAPPKKSEQNSTMDRGVVTDPHAPELYSRKAIMGFSVLVLPLFGSVLFAMNLWRLEKPGFVPVVIGIGGLWFVLAIIFSPTTPSVGLVYLVNATGGALLTYVLWPALMGQNVKYRKRRVWIPIMVAVCAVLVTVLLMFVMGGR